MVVETVPVLGDVALFTMVMLRSDAGGGHVTLVMVIFGVDCRRRAAALLAGIMVAEVPLLRRVVVIFVVLWLRVLLLPLLALLL